MNLYKHQLETCAMGETSPKLLDASDPGTGKTIAHLALFAARRRAEGGRALVLCPKTIMQPAWGNDIEHFCPDISYVLATATNRAAAFAAGTDIVITNHDAASWIVKNKVNLSDFDTLIVDESTAVKNPNAARSKAVRKLSRQFNYISCLTGTPNPKGICCIWHQALILDGGARLGTSFSAFRDATCVPEQIAPHLPHVRWVDKPGIENFVAALLDDITIRHRLEDCIDMPEHVTYKVPFVLNKKHRKAYELLKETAIIALEQGDISAINKAALQTKLLQLLSGAVYTEAGTYVTIDDARYKLAIDLINQRPHSLCAFLFKHQRDNLVALATAAGIEHAVIDGDVPVNRRTEIVQEFQAGNLQTIFAHPQSAGHGLTLTKGTATIWPSPTYNAEHFIQFNRRIYRNGQTQRTETIMITAQDSIEERVFDEVLSGKLARIDNLLELLTT